MPEDFLRMVKLHREAAGAYDNIAAALASSFPHVAAVARKSAAHSLKISGKYHAMANDPRRDSKP